MIKLRHYTSTDGLLDCSLVFGGSFAIVFLSGRAETNAARELHVFLRTHILSHPKEYNLLIFLEHVTFLSSTALGTLGQLYQVAKRYFILSGARPEVRKGLTPVGIAERPGSVYIFRDYAELQQKMKVPPQLAAIIAERFEQAKTFEKAEIQEADIIKSYHPDWTLPQIQDELRKLYPYISEAYSSNYLVVPARFEAAVVTFTFLRRLAKDYGLFDPTGEANHALSSYDCEVLAKEITENIVRWGFSEQSGGFIAKASVNEATLTIGFADWGSGYQPNLINKMLRLGGQGHKRIAHLVQSLYPAKSAENVVRSVSPAPVLRREQKVEIEKRLGPQRFGPGYVFVMRWPVRKRTEIDYQDGAYPADLVMSNV